MGDAGLVGRVESRDFILKALGRGTGVAVVLGDPGAGKTALLAAVADAQRLQGVRVVEVTGRPLEADLPFAAVVELLTSLAAGPTGARTDELALLTADPLRQRLEVLRRIEEQANGALLLVVDDAQWIDASSLSMLAFVANRISGTAVTMAVAARGEVAPKGFAFHPVAPLPLLETLEARLVVRRTGLDLDDVLVETIVTAADGNPLALVELARAAAAGKMTRADTLLPMSVRLEQAFAAELPELPALTRELLVRVAAGADDLGSLGAVSAEIDVLAALGPAERCGLVKVGDGRIAWRHPLARAATYAAATADERSRAHRALAGLPSQAPDRRAWHLARAAVGPDEVVAAELEAAAARAQHWGGFVEASNAMQRSAELSPDADARSRRLVRTAELAVYAGQFARPQELARQVRHLTDDPALGVRVDYAIAYTLSHTTRQHSARLALLEVLERAWESDSVVSWASLTSLAALALRTGEGAHAVGEWQRRLESVDQPASWPASEVMSAARTWVRSVAGESLARTPDLVDEVLRPSTLAAGAPAEAVFNSEMLLGSAAWLVDEHDEAQRRLSRAAELMLQAEAPGELAQTLAALGLVRFEMGRWDDAEETSYLLSDVTEARGLDYLGHCAAELRARVAAVRGNVDEALEIVRAIDAAVDPGEWIALTCDLIRTRGLAALSCGDIPLAYAHLRGLFREDGTPLHWRTSLLGIGDLAAAAARTGHVDQVAPLVDWASGQIGEHPSGRIRLVVARAVAQVSGPDAGPWFEEAIAVKGAETWPFEQACAQLDYGTWLRRERRTTTARDQLYAAMTTFERLGAPTWTELARAELRAAGVTTGAPVATAWSSLTAQERRVVRLAAAGLSNREIGEELFLSPRTISTHLRNAFPKLGVTSRGRLRDVVVESED